MTVTIALVLGILIGLIDGWLVLKQPDWLYQIIGKAGGLQRFLLIAHGVALLGLIILASITGGSEATS